MLMHNRLLCEKKLLNEKEVIEYHEKSLKIYEEIGEKNGIAIQLNNIGAFLIEKDIYKSFFYLMKSIALHNQIGTNPKNPIEFIIKIRKKIGLVKFKVFYIEVIKKFDPELLSFFKLEEFICEPKRVDKKLGRNDPCFCGSGKKFKNCHGAASQSLLNLN